jgi:hypothetical protein
MADSGPPQRTILSVATTSPLVKAVGLVAILAVAALSLRISLTNAFVYVNWADARSYAEGARRVFAAVSPYSEMQLAGPYPIDHASFGLGFVYPPSGAYLLAPFTIGEPFWYLWNALSFVALIGVVLLMVRRELGGLSLTASVAVAALGVTLFQPGLTDLETGYLSPMIAAATGVLWLWPRWSGWISVLLGLVKVFPAAGLLWAMRRGQEWKAPLVVGGVVVMVVTIAQPSFLADWVTALGNAEAACPAFAFVSFGCLGVPWLGYVAASGLLAAAWRAARDDASFLLLGLAMTVPYPDLYWGNLMVPMVAAIPLVIRMSRQWIARATSAPTAVGQALPRPDASS